MESNNTAQGKARIQWNARTQRKVKIPSAYLKSETKCSYIFTIE